MCVGDSALSNRVQAITAPHGVQIVSTHKNEEPQNNCLFYFVELLQHHVVALGDLFVVAMETFFLRTPHQSANSK